MHLKDASTDALLSKLGRLVALSEADSIHDYEQLTLQIERMLAESKGMVYRVRAHADRRRRQGKEGRAISTARREQLGEWAGSLRDIASGIDTLLEETAPPKAGPDEAVKLLAEFEAFRARRLGVQIPA